MADVALTTLLVKGPAANNEVGRGWTHKLEIDFTDFLGVTSVADADTVTVSCFTIPANSIVQSVGFRLVTAFDDSGGGTTATMILGDDDDDNGFELARVIHVDGTEVFIGANTGAYFIGTDSGSATTSNVIKGKTYTAAKTVKALFTPTGFKMEESTQGKIVIFADILDTNILISG